MAPRYILLCVFPYVEMEVDLKLELVEALLNFGKIIACLVYRTLSPDVGDIYPRVVIGGIVAA